MILTGGPAQEDRWWSRRGLFTVGWAGRKAGKVIGKHLSTVTDSTVPGCLLVSALRLWDVPGMLRRGGGVGWGGGGGRGGWNWRAMETSEDRTDLSLV